MADEQIFYLIYRIYPDYEHDGPYLYGWTSKKNVAKAFLHQRDEKKYILEKYTEDNLVSQFSESSPAENLEIDYVKLRSVNNDGTILFFTTLNELQEVEKNIQKMFRDLSSLDNITQTKHGKDVMDYLKMFINIDDYYGDALYDIGFRPKEVDIIFDSVNNETMDEDIEYSYTEGIYLTEWCTGHKTQLPGQLIIEEVANKIMYSLESFVKVLYQDL